MPAAWLIVPSIDLPWPRSAGQWPVVPTRLGPRRAGQAGAGIESSTAMAMAPRHRSNWLAGKQKSLDPQKSLTLTQQQQASAI